MAVPGSSGQCRANSDKNPDTARNPSPLFSGSQPEFFRMEPCAWQAVLLRNSFHLAYGDIMRHWLNQNRRFILFLLCFGVFRTAVADWNPIPSGSMRPNLLEGDVVLVNRLAYNLKLPLTDRILARLSDPQRGDIVTFSAPDKGTRLIKRIMAVPGDVVEMRQEVLFINGQAATLDVAREVAEPDPLDPNLRALHINETIAGPTHRVQLLSRGAPKNSFGPITIPADQFLMLGDNRDNSADSRYFGLVERRLLIGQASRILVSADIMGNWLPRFERFGHKLL
jgi:signal peptidase I